jgi:hypothetical protein
VQLASVAKNEENCLNQLRITSLQHFHCFILDNLEQLIDCNIRAPAVCTLQ